MKTTIRACLSIVAVASLAALIGCSAFSSTKSPDVAGDIRKSLKQAGLKDVAVSQDQEKGVVTLGGHVAQDSDKTQAESIAKSLAGNQVVANQIAVIPVGAEKDAKAISSDLDKGIEGNLAAALIQAKLDHDVKYSVKNRVVTLTGEVHSQSTRDQSQQIAATVPNVDQVVNELQVTRQKATSSN